jgi:5-hydroxyisourate hydrolase-like protein (transthyretin family)
MKRISILLVILFFSITQSMAQNTIDTYKKEWQIIDSLLTVKGLPKSAYSKVEILYKKAKASNNQLQCIKALIYKLDLQNMQTEEQENLNLAALQTEIDATKNPINQSILYCILAKKYANYLQNFRWQIGNRKQTNELAKPDLKLWSVIDFETNINNCFAKAMANKNELQAATINNYQLLLVYANERKLRPTIFDIIAQEAIAYYSNSNQNSNEIPLKLLSKTEAYLQLNFGKKNTEANEIKIANLFQQLLGFHKNDKQPDAFIDVNIDRIEWAYKNSVAANKDTLYVAALQEIVEQFADNKIATQAWYLLANFYANQAQTFDAFNNTKHRWAFKKALDIINSRKGIVVEKCDGNKNLDDLYKHITHPSLFAKTEQANVANEAFKMLIEFKNTDTLYYRVIKLENKIDNTIENDNNDFWNWVTTKKYLAKYSQTLNNPNDYQQHRVEIKIDPLPAGKYAILGSNTKNFDSKKGNLFYTSFDVTNIALITNNNNFFVLDRSSGKPLEAAKISIYTNKWNQNKQQHETVFLTEIITNANGFGSLTKIDENNFYSVTYKIEHNNETYIYNGATISASIYNDNSTAESAIKDNANLKIFTDRSIYRPSQTVYFKAIATTKNKDAKHARLYVEAPIAKAFLRDANYQIIDSVNVSLNKYGSCNGKFVLPKKCLTGNFSITFDGIIGETNFNVEEYKRPKFMVEFLSNKNTYSLQDSILVQGNAMAFAGNAIDNANVVYTVTRAAKFMYPWLCYKPYNNIEGVQIATGVCKTDSKGNFTVNFTAIADASIDKATLPIFDFTIEASVTDINGENRTASKTISIGYQSLVLIANVPEKINNAAFKTLDIIANNLDGEKVAADISIKLYKLETPTRLIRQKYWQQPDVFVMTQQEHLKHFAFDAYSNETNKTQWKQELEAINTVYNFDPKSNNFELPNALAVGVYLLECSTKDNHNNTVVTKNYIEVFSNSLQPIIGYNNCTYLKTQLAQNDSANLVISSNAKDVFVIKTLSQPNKIVGDWAVKNKFSFVLLQQQYSWQEAACATNFAMQYCFVKHNRFFEGGSAITLLSTQNNLELLIQSFRDKTLPGSKETYSLTIKNNHNKKVDAELLASMYDESLDVLQPHNWHIENYENNEGYFANGQNNFTAMGFGEFTSQNSNNDYYRNFIVSNTTKLATSLQDFMPDFQQYNRNHYRRNIATNGTFAWSNGNQPMMASAMTFDAAIGGKVAGLVGAAHEIVQRKEEKVIETTPNNIAQPARKNFNETAFFYPSIYADSAGNYTFFATLPEAVTKWKLMCLAHTKDAAFGAATHHIITQKPLMVQPNFPRFLKEGDVIELTTKIVNLNNTAIAGKVQLELIDASTGNSVDGWFVNVFPTQYFWVDAGKSSLAKFPIQVPMGFNKPLLLRLSATSKIDSNNNIVYSDAEENVLPIISNKILITEAKPLYVKANSPKATFVFDDFKKNTDKSAVLFSVEYTSNPIWTVVQSLPYLLQPKIDCIDQIGNQLFANAMAVSILKNNPLIATTIKSWLQDSTTHWQGLTNSLQSKIANDNALQSILLNETPWMASAANEQEQRKNLALLFDEKLLENQWNETLTKLASKQLANGAFSWFDGGREDNYMTQYIATAMGKLLYKNIVPFENANKLQTILDKALVYLDAENERQYLASIRPQKNKKNNTFFDEGYWYMRSFYSNKPLSITLKKNLTSGVAWATKNWLTTGHWQQIVLALILDRFNNQLGNYSAVKNNILLSVKEHLIEDTAYGSLHFKANNGYYSRHQNNFELHTLFTEALGEILKDISTINQLNTWLLLNKQTNKWESNVATAAACYTLLTWEKKALATNNKIKIELGNGVIITPKDTANIGYVQQNFDVSKLDTLMSEIKITNSQSNSQPSYGAVYYQYLADANEVVASTNSPLQLTKKVFIEKNNGTKKVLEIVQENEEVTIGDKLIIRIELKANRAMEYLHLKDMRAANTEPTNVLSQFKWQEGLSYYESTKDVATNFFISNINKGTYVFEYPVTITHSGICSIGIASIECMYAPEFKSHSQGVVLRVK